MEGVPVSQPLGSKSNLASRSGAGKEEQQDGIGNDPQGRNQSSQVSGCLTDEVEKPPPLVPIRWNSSQVRRTVTFPARISREPAIRPHHEAVAEEPSIVLERQESPCGTLADQPSYLGKPQTREGNLSPSTATVIKLSIVGKPDLPRTRQHTADTAPPPVKVLEAVVHKLEATEYKRNCSENDKPRSRFQKGTVISPSQRLQRVAAMRRQHVLEGSIPLPAHIEQQHAAQPPDSVCTTTAPPPPAQGPKTDSQVSEAHEASAAVQAQEQQQLPHLLTAEDDSNISDRDVLRGLRIICAASADVRFDAMVREKTGLRLRRFLADLQSIEFGSLGEFGFGG